ncbi:phospholipase D-like domain-containing protein [Xylophilus sp.]|uniref:phospholipase D-like domain-containing protein n=1 Tax=Xylophilus sp. TaxID=2653893 RepID=UPI002D7FF75F|nr:phospholipase D family protein [Xylophilus sp.]
MARAAQSDRPADASPRADSGFGLLASSEAAYGSRAALIEAATRTLDLQYYSIHYDSSTEALLQRLRAAARRGVRIRILIDDFNAAGDNIKVLALDNEPNVQVRMFNPLPGPRRSQFGRIVSSLLDFQRVQQRMHNKLLVADSALAVTGGRNLSNEYFGQGESSNFLDLDVLVAGRIVGPLTQSFDTYWNDKLAYPVRTLLTDAEQKSLDAAAASASPAPSAADDPAARDSAAQPQTPASVPLATPPGAAAIARDIEACRLKLVWAPATLLVDQPSKIGSDDPADPDETAVGGLLALAETARRDLLIVSPYFVPGERMMKTFTGLRQRGVRVRVLTNSLASNDAPLAHVGYARYREALLKLGVELYELQSHGDGDGRVRIIGSTPGSRSSLHSKALVVDDRFAAIGSMNLDLRSKIQNTEVGLVVRSRALSQQLSGHIENAIARSYRVELRNGKLLWHPPASSQGTPHAAPLETEPDAGAGLRLLLRLVGPLAPDELL